MADEDKAFQPLDIVEIKRRLPHRYPFLLIDRITDMDLEAKTVVGRKCVSSNEPFFEGHFPTKPIMPGVLTVEAMAQTAAILVSEALPEAAGKLVFFMSVEKARFRRPITPGDVICFEVALLQSKRNVYKFTGKALVDGKVAAEADFSAMIADG